MKTVRSEEGSPRCDIKNRVGGVGREGGKKRHVRKTLVSVAIPLEGRDFKLANLSDQKNNDITDRQQGGGRTSVLSVLC